MSQGRRTVVHLLRHGEVYNPEKLLYGRLPGYRLSGRGVEMAETAARWFDGRDIVGVVSSPLQRARETAAPVASTLGLEIVVDERLTEAANVFQGRRVSGPDGVLAKPSSWWNYRNPFRPSWGEPYEQVAQRVLAAARAAKDLAEGREVVCVSHQLPIVCARRYAEGRRLWHDPRKRQCSLASVTSLTFAGDYVIGVDYAEPSGSTPNSMREQQTGV